MMNQLKQQFAIINRIKCLVKKTGSSFFRRRKDPGISEDIAKKIQKSAYDLSHLKQKDIITPPYLDIVEQLQVDDDQIFRAAVYNLTNIAVNEERHAAEIIKALEETAFQCNRSGEQLDYVKSKINVIKNKLRNK